MRNIERYDSNYRARQDKRAEGGERELLSRPERIDRPKEDEARVNGVITSRPGARMDQRAFLEDRGNDGEHSPVSVTTSEEPMHGTKDWCRGGDDRVCLRCCRADAP